MPWTAAQAKDHKKGLTPTQAQAWAKIANHALSDCASKNGSDCEGRAIRIANAAVDKVGKATEQGDLVLRLEARITKSYDVRRRIFGYASIAVLKNGQPLLDLQGDVIEIDDLAEGWYGYVKESGQLNFQHQDGCAAALIEAMVFTPDKLEALGLAPDALPLGAWVGYEIETDADYAYMKEAGFVMFSIEGFSLREPL